MNTTPLDWNTSYRKDRDYLALTTAAITHILDSTSIHAPKTHLDIGCGTGQLVRELYHRGYTTRGIDTSSEAIRIARASTVFTGASLQLDHLDLRTLLNDSALENSFGLITCKYVYAFLDAKQEFLEQVASALHPAGTFYIISPDPTRLTPDKKSIGVHHESTHALLAHYFDVTSHIFERDIHYVCRRRD